MSDEVGHSLCILEEKRAVLKHIFVLVNCVTPGQWMWGDTCWGGSRDGDDQSKVDKALVQEDSAKTIGQGNQEVGWIVRRPRSKQDKVRNWAVYTAAAEIACTWGPSCPSQGAFYMLPAEPGAEDEAPHLDNPLFSSSRRVVGRKVSVAGVGSEPIQCFYVTEYLCK